MQEANPWEVEKMIYNLEITLAEMEEKALLKGRAEGKAEGKAEGRIEGEVIKAQDAICKYLKKRFGDTSADLQQKIKEVTSLEVLDSIMEELFASNTWEEAQTIINDGLKMTAFN